MKKTLEQKIIDNLMIRVVKLEKEITALKKSDWVHGPISEGRHEARIIRVKRQKSAAGYDMWMLEVEVEGFKTKAYHRIVNRQSYLWDMGLNELGARYEMHVTWNSDPQDLEGTRCFVTVKHGDMWHGYRQVIVTKFEAHRG